MSSAPTAYVPVTREAKHRLGDHTQTTILVAVWAILTLVAAFRWLGIGRDYLEYLAYYETIPAYLFTSTSRFEPGFQLLSWLFRNQLDLDYGYLVLLVSGASLGIKFYLFRKYLRYPLLAAATYVAIFYPIHEYTQIRTGLALALAYLAVHKLLEGRWLAGAAFLVAGYLFHTSVIVVPVAFLAARFIRGNVIVFALGIVAAALFLISDQLRAFIVTIFSSANPLLQAYVENRTLDVVSIFSVTNLLLLAAVVAGIAANWFNAGRYHATFLTMAIGAVLAVLVLSSAPMIAVRTKEVLFVSVVFLAYRSRITLRNFAAMGFLWILAIVTAYLAFREGLILI